MSTSAASIVYNGFSVRVRAFVSLIAPCGVRVRHPHVCSGTQNCILSCSMCVSVVWRACKAPSRVQCVSFFLFFCRPHTRPSSKRETKNKHPLREVFFWCQSTQGRRNGRAAKKWTARKRSAGRPKMIKYRHSKKYKFRLERAGCWEAKKESFP